MSNEIIHPKMTFDNKLRFTPYAWAKMLYMRDHGDTEIAGYGITGTEDPLLVTDFRLIKSDCTNVSFDMDPEDGIEFMDTMLDAGLMPWQFQRILAHSHPGISPNPSGTDETNFEKVFTRPDWAIMLIVAENGAVYCRLKFNVGPGGTQMLKIEVDFTREFQASNHAAWTEEYEAKVKKLKFSITTKEDVVSSCYESFPINHCDDREYPSWWNETDLGCETIDEIDCHWDCCGNVLYLNNIDYMWYTYNPVNKQWFVEAEEEDNNSVTGVDKPDQPWADQIIAWAEKYDGERQLAMEKNI